MKAFQPLPWFLLGAATLAIRLFGLNRFSYWLDEILEVYTIRCPWGSMWRGLRAGVFNPPLDYAMLKFVEAFHPADATRRLLPVAWGVGCVIAFGVLIGRRSHRVTGLAAGVLAAVAPYHVRYSQELRPYALGMFLVSFTLLLLDRYLAKPSGRRLAGVCLGSIATSYAMYLAALVLVVAGAAMVIEDSFDPDDQRRRAARRFAIVSPLLLLLGVMAYIPWWPALWRALHAPPFSAPPQFAWRRVGRLFSYFGFGFHDWYPLGRAGAFFVLLVVVGALLALRQQRLRFLVVWAAVGLTVIELLEQKHGVYDSVFHFVPAGLALTGLAAVPIGWLLRRRGFAWCGIGALVVCVALSARAVTFYFEHGRPDWRPVAAFLRAEPPSATIFVDSPYTQLCLAYYVNGPDRFCRPSGGTRQIVDVGDNPSRLMALWGGTHDAWLVTPGNEKTAALRAWSESFPTLSFPTAEGDGGVLVRRLKKLN